jgi:hypothetical protein
MQMLQFAADLALGAHGAKEKIRENPKRRRKMFTIT